MSAPPEASVVPSQPAQEGRPRRPALVIIANSLTPYRKHVHERIVREMPEIRLWSVFTHERSNAPWSVEAPPEIGPVSFGQGEASDDQAKLTNAMREWRKGGRIIRWLRDQSVAAVLLQGYNDPGRLRVLSWCRRRGVPCFLFGDSNIRGDLARGTKAFAKRIIVGHVVRTATAVMPCGTLGQAYFERYGADPERVFYFPYEPDYDLIRSLSTEQVAAAALRLGLRPHRRRIVFSGRLIPVKRPDLVLEAFARIAEERPEWDLVMVGDGPLKDELRSRIPPAIQDRTIWTGFLDDQADVSAIYRASDVLVLPSDYEPWALVINEAAAAGMAIVCTSVVGAAAELVRDGINGRLFPIGDVDRLTECLLDVTRPERLAAMKAASAEVLRQWRERGDPVAGLRKALQFCGVLPPSPEKT